jgi:sirohydrochlorin cobaltochelatase
MNKTVPLSGRYAVLFRTEDVCEFCGRFFIASLSPSDEFFHSGGDKKSNKKEEITMKKHKKVAALMLAAVLCLSLAAGCATSGKSIGSDPAGPGSAPAVPAGIGAETPKKAILVVSFGTSYNDNRDLSIGAVENALQAAYSDYEVRRAFTSQIIIDKLKQRDGLVIDNVTEALERLVADGVKEVLVQPTHIMSGYEYNDIVAEVTPYRDKFDSLVIGAPLLDEAADYEKLVLVLAEETKSYRVPGTAVVFMGHGTGHEANDAYTKLQRFVTDAGYENCFIGTVEAAPTIEDVLALVKASGAKKVVLLPLMLVAGDHATNDMAGDEEDSWKSVFEAEGFAVECVLKGIGQYPGVQEMYVAHAGRAMAQAKNTNGEPQTGGETAPAESETLAPIYGNQIKDGTYNIEVSSNSSMFRIIDARLTVSNGEMTALLTLSGDGYLKLYMGTGEQALSDTDDKCIYYVENEEGKYTYTVPVAALDEEIDCAAWSIKKESWYDRVLVFRSSSLPAEAFTGK